MALPDRGERVRGAPSKGDVALLTRVPGIAEVWQNVTYHSRAAQSPEVIGADALWGSTLATAGQGIKIAVLDDGIDVRAQIPRPDWFQLPAGVPEGTEALHDAEGDRRAGIPAP